ncbi:MAG: hypothetical protein E7268_04270 [Lachnospiraceae bacterium]|nr:hypothetical protein [Lachnospiraceae bacterium]
MTLYMSLGMCMGMLLGVNFGLLLFDNLALGLPIGISTGMCIGIAIGAAKDKRLSEHMMKISRIEDVSDSTDKLVYAIDENGEEKEYRMNEKRIISEKFSVGDRVAEEKAGYLVSLESK